MNASNPEGSEPRRESGPQEATNAHLSPQGPPAAGQQATSPHASGGYPVYPAYPDNSSSGNQSAQFGESTAVTEAGGNALRYHGQQLADGLYGDGTELHPINNPAANGWMHTKGTGRLRIGEALSWPLKAFAANPGTLLLIGGVFAAVTVLSRSPSAPLFLAMVVGLGVLLIVPLIISLGLQQTLACKIRNLRAPAYGKTLGMLLLLNFLQYLATSSLFAAASLFGMPSVDEMVTDPNPTLGELHSIINPSTVVVSLAVLVLTPLFIYTLFYAADNNRTFSYALGEGMAAGARTYLPTLGLIIVLSIADAIGAAAMLLSSNEMISPWSAVIATAVINLVMKPYALLAVAHAYRQVSGGPVPHHVEPAAVTTTEAPVS